MQMKDEIPFPNSAKNLGTGENLMLLITSATSVIRLKVLVFLWAVFLGIKLSLCARRWVLSGFYPSVFEPLGFLEIWILESKHRFSKKALFQTINMKSTLGFMDK